MFVLRVILALKNKLYIQGSSTIRRGKMSSLNESEDTKISMAVIPAADLIDDPLMRANVKMVLTFRQMFPKKVEVAGSIKQGDMVRFKQTEHVASTLWGTIVGKVTEMREGAPGDEARVDEKGGFIQDGPKETMVAVLAFDNSFHFTNIEDLARVEAGGVA